MPASTRKAVRLTRTVREGLRSKRLEERATIASNLACSLADRGWRVRAAVQQTAAAIGVLPRSSRLVPELLTRTKDRPPALLCALEVRGLLAATRDHSGCRPESLRRFSHPA